MIAAMLTTVLPRQDPPPGEEGEWWEDIIPPPPIGNPADIAGDAVSSLVQDEFGAIMEGTWTAGLWLLEQSFGLADTLTRFDLAGQFSGNGGLARIWPAIWGLAIMIALALFFMQLTTVALRGGRGMWRAASGPVQFGLALALVLSLITSLLAAADGLTTGFLELGVGAADFRTVLGQEDMARVFGENPDLGESLEELTRSIVLGVAGVFGILAAITFGFEMVIRQAIILVLVATIPIAAAGLVSDATSSWFWRAARWTAAAIVLKPALALVLVIAVNILAGAEGIGGLLAGCGILFASIFCPWAVYKLLAFVDPSTGAGSMVRDFARHRGGDSEPARDGGSSEATNTARFAEQTAGRGGGSPADSLATNGAGNGAPALPSSGAAGSGGATAQGAGAAGRGAAAGAAGGGAASGAAAAGGAAAGAGAAVVAGYQLAKGAGEKFGARMNTQGAMAGVGHPGPVPPGGGSTPQLRSGSGGASPAAGGDDAAPGGPAPDVPPPDTPQDEQTTPVGGSDPVPEPAAPPPGAQAPIEADAPSGPQAGPDSADHATTGPPLAGGTGGSDGGRPASEAARAPQPADIPGPVSEPSPAGPEPQGDEQR